jgi:multiple sugar transport system permease protein
MREKKLIKLFKVLGIIFLLIFCLAPFVWMIFISLNKNPDFLSPQTGFALTLNNYIEVATSDKVHFWDYLINSLVVSIASALLATLFASFSAYSITRLKFTGRIIIPIMLLGFSMFPQIAIVGYLFEMITDFGWLNSYAALIFPYITLGLPLALWIMLSYFSQLSTELDRAALIDGANRLQILFKIILPLALPALFSTFMLTLIYSFNEFLFALMLTTDYHGRTIPVGIALFEGLHGQIPWGYIMAAAVIAVIPVLILVALFQKYVIHGLTEGAVKG